MEECKKENLMEEERGQNKDMVAAAALVAVFFLLKLTRIEAAIWRKPEGEIHWKDDAC